MSAAFPPPVVKVFSVGELTRAIKSVLEEGFTPVWVEGEVSNLAKPNSGHLYLTLKDEDAPLKAVVYRGVALRMRFDLADGMRVIVRGRLTVYAPRGEYQLQIEEVQPKGIGPLELAYRAAHPAAHRPRHQPHRLGRARHAGNPVTALAGR
jgi:exodeoxyribonuclease VII large subunit